MPFFIRYPLSFFSDIQLSLHFGQIFVSYQSHKFSRTLRAATYTPPISSSRCDLQLVIAKWKWVPTLRSPEIAVVCSTVLLVADKSKQWKLQRLPKLFMGQAFMVSSNRYISRLMFSIFFEISISLKEFIWQHVTSSHGPLTKYLKLRVTHAPGMPETFPRHLLQRKTTN